MPYDVIVSSLSPKVLKDFKDIEPNISTGLILAFSYGNFYNVKFVDFFCIEKDIVTNEMIRKIQKNGKEYIFGLQYIMTILLRHTLVEQMDNNWWSTLSKKSRIRKIILI